jgi:hypothetical protein
MPRTNLNDGQELIYQDLNKMSARLERELYDRVWYETLLRVQNAFFQDGLLVSYVGAATLSVNAGLGFQTDNTQLDPEPTKRPVFNSAAQNVALSPADAALDRIDIVCVQAARANVLTETRKYKDPSTGAISNQSLVTESDWQCALQVVAGTPNASPAVPATPAGWIKLAEVRVHAVTGVTGSGDLTDRRAKLPVGGDIVFNTLGKLRMTAGATTPLSQLLSDIDAALTNGYHGYLDLDVLGADPALPGASKVRVYQKSGVMYFLDSAGVVNPIGSGSGGGGGANWYAAPATAPIEDTENGEKVWLFDATAKGVGVQQVELFVKVPSGYIAGRQIKMNLGLYSPSASGTMLLQARTTLVRKNNDAMTSTANQRTTTNTALTNTVANQYREANLDLTDALGKINGFAVSAGDLVKVELFRGTDTDTADARFVPSATEITFS